MTLFSALIILAFLTALMGAIFGLFNRRSNPLIAAAGFVTMLVAGVGAWYALMETQSIPWTIVDGIIAVLGLIAGCRNVFPRKGAA